MDLPPEFTKPDLSAFLANDTIPSNINSSTISYVGEFLSAPLPPSASDPCTAAQMPDDGQTISLRSPYFSQDQAGNRGWTTVETVIIRLNNCCVPSSHFPVYSNKSAFVSDWFEVTVGYDAAVCVQKYEPWIVETYNTSIVPPATFRIVEKGNGSNSSSPSGHIQGTPIANFGYLNATGKEFAFAGARANSIFPILESDDHMDIQYNPSLTVGPVVPLCTTVLLTS